ncbi:fused MFS/spermidine synthase [Bacteriovorax sp. Seq25_V]|uniref:fused MFS/spermidine synthase n=1 Tax=Bacteriovorax sp. Seq25_V TaxID=1201288 RepID=UPI00038A0AF7|nr:fused MFS/spermidine synthase [Bacteriovorax sp. Seq25_V]EQC45425.1 spermine/spermidine synthase [Bacteriovorax sp. Seq25_V]
MAYFYSFLIGFLIMGIEVVAIRIAQFQISANVIVISTILSVILSSLMLGNFLGAFIARQRRSTFIFGVELLLTATFLLVMHKFVLADFFNSAFIRDLRDEFYITLIFSLLFYALPNLVFGQALPLLFKINENKQAIISDNTARILGVSSLGSILGTFLTSLALLPIFGQKLVISIFCSLLFLCALFLMRDKKMSALSLIIFTTIFSINFEVKPYAVDEIIHERETSYGQLKIHKTKDWLKVKTSRSTDTFISFSDIFSSQWSSSQLVWAYLNNPKKSLFLGVSGGSQILQLKALNTEGEIVGVDIDQEVVETSDYYLDRALSKNAKLIFTDARRFLQRSSQKFDYVNIDVFKTSYIPEHCITLEFYKLVFDSLVAKGVVSLNTNLAHNFFIKNVSAKNAYLKNLVNTIKTAGFKKVFYNNYTKHIFAFKSIEEASEFIESLKVGSLNKQFSSSLRSTFAASYLQVLELREKDIGEVIYTDNHSKYFFPVFDEGISDDEFGENNFLRNSFDIYSQMGRVSREQYEVYYNSIGSEYTREALARFLQLDKRNIHAKSNLFSKISNTFYYFRRSQFDAMLEEYEEVYSLL